MSVKLERNVWDPWSLVDLWEMFMNGRVVATEVWENVQCGNVFNVRIRHKPERLAMCSNTNFRKWADFFPPTKIGSGKTEIHFQQACLQY